MTLEDVFNEAREDRYAGNVDGVGYEARIVYGVKISRDAESGYVELFDVTSGHDYYEKLSPHMVKHFKEKGWRYGCYVVYLLNKRSKLDRIERSIKKEVNNLNRPAEIRKLKERRGKVLERYNEVLNLKNQII